MKTKPNVTPEVIQPIPTMSRPRILKNVVVVSVGALVLFTAYDGLTMLQSTMNSEQGIGVMSQAVLYICFCISALIFPKYVIKKIGSKQTLVLSMLSYIPYVGSNFYPHWSVMMPTSILLGFGAALLWGSQANYLNDVSVLYAELLLKNPETENEGVVRKERGQSNNGCRCISCVYVEYEGTDCCPLEDQLKGGGDGGKMLKNVTNIPKSVDGEKLGHPLSSSKCRSSCHDDISGNQNNLNQKYLVPISKEHNAKHIDYDRTGCDKDSVTPNQNLSTNASDRTAGGDKDNSQENENLPSKGCPEGVETRLSSRRSRVIESTTARFFGFHGLAFLSSAVWSNLLSYYVLQGDDRLREMTSLHSGNASCACGAAFCSFESAACLEERERQLPSYATRYVLTGVCVCLGLASVLLVALFLDPLDDKAKEEDGHEGFSLRLLSATFRLAKRTELILLMPLSMYLGMSKGFYTGDFTKAFVGCAWGTSHVGLVAVCYGAACALSSILSGWLVRRVGRTPIFTAAALLNVSSCALLLTWTPNADTPLLFFVVAAMWGCHVGAVWSQIRAFYGVLFKADEEAAFATFHTWFSLGFCLSRSPTATFSARPPKSTFCWPSPHSAMSATSLWKGGTPTTQ